MKKIWISGVLCVLMLSMVGCSSSKTSTQKATSKSTTKSSTSTVSKQNLTLEQLKKYDGQNGNPAYVAVDGTIYDVTNAKNWSNGKHKNGITAGKDLSKEIGGAPHGKSVLANLPVVGKLK